LIPAADRSARAGNRAPASCVAIATEYLAALRDATFCDAAAADPCGAQRPLVVAEGQSVESAVVTGTLCWTGGAGYVDPAQTGKLDAILTRFSAAGCTTSSCPGPALHQPRCIARLSGKPTCG